MRWSIEFLGYAQDAYVLFDQYVSLKITLVKTLKEADDSFYTLYQEQYSYFSFKCLYLKNELGNPDFLLLNCYINKMQLFTKFKKVLSAGFRATLVFRKFKEVLNPQGRIFWNCAKSCILILQIKIW